VSISKPFFEFSAKIEKLGMMQSV